MDRIKQVKTSFKWKSYKKLNFKFSYSLKYLVTDYLNNQYLFKIDNCSKYDDNEMILRVLNKIHNSNIMVEAPILYEYGLYNQNLNSYSIYHWVKGDDLYTIIDNLPYSTRYHIGYIIGKQLASIHQIKVDDVDWKSSEKINVRRWRNVSRYLSSRQYIYKHDVVINFLNKNFDSLKYFNPCYIHNSFHSENIIIYNEKKIGLVSFDRLRVDDPIYDLIKIQLYNKDKSYNFCLGVIEGYFNKKIPNGFWLKYATLTAYNCISQAIWASQNNLWSVLNIDQIVKNVLTEYNDFKSIIPNWYTNTRIKPVEKQFNFGRDINRIVFDD